ncbi:hypothetical protein EV684_105224 [Rubrivivax gelatinosus]|uniref:Uncharacterized protein n=1 Tax=Rubrivivax gelatinosus TaxID=28068 RepID=A0A4V2SGY9_RUBGE|nr:hypothetical protein [Rubrivivax gelatinosus]TCP03058.1 hypothetical protein EV684_105224 [Rubrivivax gelatinosus]
MPSATASRLPCRACLPAGAVACLAPGAMRVGRALAALRSYGSPAVPSAAVRGLRPTVQA